MENFNLKEEIYNKFCSIDTYDYNCYELEILANQKYEELKSMLNNEQLLALIRYVDSYELFKEKCNMALANYMFDSVKEIYK